jgi:secondary thiamine-phosphate synthase enzyme
MDEMRLATVFTCWTTNLSFKRKMDTFVLGKMSWNQVELTLPGFPRGFHLITSHILNALPELHGVKVGLLHVFIQHTSASLTINENADPDVQVDLESAINSIVPEDFPYIHTIEGPDDMPAHVKASMMGSSVMLPIRDGRLALGTWQGIYLCEHRNRGGRRRLVLTVCGEPT